MTEGKQVLPGDGGERLTKQNKETLWGDGYFQHHDCRDGFKGTHKHQNLPNCTRYTCVHKLYSNKVVFYKKKNTLKLCLRINEHIKTYQKKDKRIFYNLKIEIILSTT